MNTYIPKSLALLLAACLSLPALAQTSIASFSPSGVIKQVRQARAQFSAQMVPFGDLRPADPFDIDCPEAGSGRWADGRNWVYDFARDLPAGVVCRFTLKAGLKDLAGQALSGAASYSFSTGGPAIVEAVPFEGRTDIDEQQIFVLGLDAPAQEATIAEHAYCRADGVNEKIGVRLLQGREREQVLALRKNFVERYLKVYYAARGVLWHATLALPGKRLDTLPLALLQCQRTLPANTKVSLVWGPGIASASGVATTAAQTLPYKTRPEFTASFGCERSSAKAQCIPFLPLRLAFTAPIRARDARAITLTSESGKVFRVAANADNAKAEYLDSVSFAGPLPEKTRFTITLPAGLKDDAGRPLLNRARFPMTVRTDEQPPLVKFPASFGILEARGDRLLPVTVRNVEASLAAKVSGADVNGNMLRLSDDQDKAIIDWLKRLSGGEYWQPGAQYGEEMGKPVLAGHANTRSFALPKPNGKRAFEVIGIPLQKPGFYVVELASPRLGAVLLPKPRTAYIHTAALVTNLAAHFKHGAQSSLVWVTSLDKGAPVAKAQVAVRDCAGNLLWQGATDASGVAHIKQELERSQCSGNHNYFVSARSGGDMTFTLSNWVGGIEAWRFNLPTADLHDDNTLLSTVFDRTLLRAGETVHMKHFLRRHTAGGIAHAAPGNGPGAASQVIITHQGSDQRFELPLRWSAGAAQNEWVIPADAKQGVYEVSMAGRQSGSFRVESFRVPTMKAVLQGPKAAAVQPSKVDLDVQLNYLSGGGAGNAAVKLRTVLQDKSLSFADYDDFTFSNGDVKEGLVKSGAAAAEDDEGNWDEEAANPLNGPARTQNLNLDRAGGARVTVDQLPALTVPRDLLAELAYQDANGETLSVSTRVPLWPSKNLIGIKPDGWALSKDAFKFQVVVLDTAGKPVAGAPVAVDFFQRKTYSHRRRLIGGFYSYESSSEVLRLGAACEGKTDARGLLLCQVKAPASGNLILRAKTVDEDRRAAYANRETWVAGSGDWWFNVGDNDRIDVLPEKKRYEPGEEARLQVRMPFREGTALVTVEREGMIDTYVRQLSGREPVIAIPVKASYAPNVYVSVLVVRGRVAGVQPTALVDLGKPAYKMGIAALRVGWQAHELKVRVTADKEVYKTREKAQVKVKVQRADGRALPAGAEVALAAVDVGLLELMPNTSWDLLETMMQQRSLQVETSTAQMQVIGKRHFGRKAFPHGGGGGKGASRELFDTLLFWKGSVKLDANGEAAVQVPLNDSLTAFRLVAIANAGADLFGTGKADIRSTQDLIVMSGLPALVREGDQFRAGFTVRNTSAEAMTAQLAASVHGQTLAPQSLTLAPGQAQEVAWTYPVPLGVKELVWDVSAKAGEAGDKLRVKQKVTFAVPVRTYQATLLQVDKPQSMTVQMPADALPGRGGVQTVLSAKLGNDLPGVREYMGAYPYSCFEQQTSKAIALGDAAMWRAMAAALPAYLDGDGMLKYFPSMDKGSDSLTAYVLSATAEAGYAIPEQAKNRMEEALANFVQGRVIRYSAMPTADLAVRKLAALEALSRSAKVAPDALDSIAVEPNLWPTSALIDWYLVLKRTPKLARRDALLAEAQQMLRARLNFQGTTMGFSTEQRDNWWWLMVSGDVNANRLLLAVLDNPGWKDDIGRLVRGTLGRQLKGRWNTTVANAWGTLAIRKFSEKFESEAVTGSTSVNLGRAEKAVKWNGQTLAAPVLQAWPRAAEQLKIAHAGTGKPWATVVSLAAIPLKAPLSSGYKISKSVTAIEQKTAGVWSRGDVYRVRLDLEAQADMTWVVVDDPIPASASVLGTGLGGDSSILSAGEKRAGWVRPAFEERSFDAFRAYYDYVPKGKWSIEYTVRLNNAGDFNLPASRVEAMYSPEMFGELPNAAVKVGL
ncbi:Ig-like domain-containing alpha-2-macroglobulin family protein [Janthinobacterium fluminis]|uniref:MG2 domain-containing protein n=1 Tax=Janthinobacterium fluminis TaxID=2987524 RepID=A0ABT5K501_9BURK|nr:Ig-like domain-containing alpha-2-macroglobulin family protein [Janthinobacterium fluminis]MDC8760067.1 MG2 domain-containing protein [Janthinobacterium fluminis]